MQQRSKKYELFPDCMKDASGGNILDEGKLTKLEINSSLCTDKLNW